MCAHIFSQSGFWLFWASARQPKSAKNSIFLSFLPVRAKAKSKLFLNKKTPIGAKQCLYRLPSYVHIRFKEALCLNKETPLSNQVFKVIIITSKKYVK